MFIGKTIKFGNSIGITIPNNIAEFEGLKAGETVKFYFKRVKVKQKW